MPHVMDYVAQKAELVQLDKEIRTWSRRVEIAGIERARHKNAREADPSVVG